MIDQIYLPNLQSTPGYSLQVYQAAKDLNGIGGGHNIAAGATIPKGKEEEFLQLLEKRIKTQLSS